MTEQMLLNRYIMHNIYALHKYIPYVYYAYERNSKNVPTSSIYI